MDTLAALAKALEAHGQPARVFDWLTAAKLIRERHPQAASAGLSRDWEWTGGEIYRDGNPVPQEDTYTYLSSVWAIPELDLDGDIIECWVWAEGSGWDSGTYWPDEALAVLRGTS